MIASSPNRGRGARARRSAAGRSRMSERGSVMASILADPERVSDIEPASHPGAAGDRRRHDRDDPDCDDDDPRPVELEPDGDRGPAERAQIETGLDEPREAETERHASDEGDDHR